MQAGENGRELQKGEKYDWKQEDDTYTLIINNPLLEDDGEKDSYFDKELIYINFVASQCRIFRLVYSSGEGGGREDIR